MEAAIGELTQNRNDGFGVMPVRRRDTDRQRDAVLLNGHLDLDAVDLLAAIDAARKATRRRATGATVDLLVAGFQRVGSSPQLPGIDAIWIPPPEPVYRVFFTGAEMAKLEHWQGIPTELSLELVPGICLAAPERGQPGAGHRSFRPTRSSITY